MKRRSFRSEAALSLTIHNEATQTPLLRFDFSAFRQYNVFSVIEMDEKKELLEEDIETANNEPLAGQISLEELIAELRLG